MWRRDKNDLPNRNGILQSAMHGRYATKHDGEITCLECGSRCFDWNAFENHPCNHTGVRTIMDSFYAARDNLIKQAEESTMADVVICDRDGKIVTRSVTGKAVYQPNMNSEYKEFTLCPDCSKELHYFLTGVRDSRPALEAFDPDKEPENGLPENKESTQAAIEHHVSDDKAYDGQ